MSRHRRAPMRLCFPLTLAALRVADGFRPIHISPSKASSSNPGNNSLGRVSLDSSTTNQEWDVDLYQKHKFVFEYGSSLVDLLDPKPGERILDVGCGSGQLTHEIAERGATVLGIDADQSMVERAQTTYPALTFRQTDVTNLSLSDDEVVDAIFSNAALHWVKDAESAIGAMSRSLKPGGRFVVEFGGKGNVGQIVQASLTVLGRSEEDNPWYFPSVAEYASLLEKHGIEVLSATLYDRPTPLEDGEYGMANWIRMFGGVLLRQIHEGSKEEIVGQIVSELKSESRLFDGENWTADYRRIRILGRKLSSAGDQMEPKQQN